MNPESFKPGDVCRYELGESSAVVEVVKVLDDPRGVAEVKFCEVIADHTGNGLFDYLLMSGKTMNASFQYLRAVDDGKAKVSVTKFGVAVCNSCGAELVCDENGDMPETCPTCGRALDYPMA